jgi:predicted TPR repeat methyltransferase
MNTPLNRILTDKDREELSQVLDLMKLHSPEMLSRKIPEANIQQQFTLFTALEFINGREGLKVLSAGAWEDTATDTLKKMMAGIVTVTDVDPHINYNLHTFRGLTDEKFDIIISTSVIEHVLEDEVFLADMCYLLKEGGHGILTMDFKVGWYQGQPLPATDVRFYGNYDLVIRLQQVLWENGCVIEGDFDWTGEDNFVYQGHQYSFATFVFTKGKSNV